MKVDSVKTQNATTFGMLYRDATSLSSPIYKQLLETKALKAFGKRYDANIEIAHFMSHENPKVSHLGLLLTDIKPAGIVQKVKNIFTQTPSDTIILKTHANTEQDLVKSIAKRKLSEILDVKGKK